MSHSLIHSVIAFRQAAKIAGITETALRNWIDRGQVTLAADEGRQRHKWRRFSALDVMRLAVMRRLVEFGFTVTGADELLREYFDTAAFSLTSNAKSEPAFDDADMLRLRFSTHNLVLTRDGRFAVMIGALPHQEAWIITASGPKERVEGWFPARGSEWFLTDTPDSFVVIQLGPIAAGVIDMLPKAPHE